MTSRPRPSLTASEDGELRHWHGQLGHIVHALAPRASGEVTGSVRCRGVALSDDARAVAVALGSGDVSIYRVHDAQVGYSSVALVGSLNRAAKEGRRGGGATGSL